MNFLRICRVFVALLAFALLLALPARSAPSDSRIVGKSRAAPAAGPSAARNVVINRSRLTDKQVAALEKSSKVRVLDGAYWYDKACGAWGLEGGPTLGFILAGLEVGGALRADASGGRTGVFVNGRELPAMDVAGLQEIAVLDPGRYWVNALGFCGHEGNPIPIMNLAVLAQAARAKSGGT